MTEGEANNGKVRIEGSCGLDMGSYQDLPPNGISIANNDAKDDCDASFVFICGNDYEDPVVSGKPEPFPFKEEEEEENAVEQQGALGHRENGAADAVESETCDHHDDPVEERVRAELDSTEVLHVSQEFHFNGVSQDVDQGMLKEEKDCVQVGRMMKQLHDASEDNARGKVDSSDSALQTHESPVESFDIAEFDPPQILDNEKKLEIGCCLDSSTNTEGTQDSQVSVIKDVQHNINVDEVNQLADLKDEASAKSPQTGSVREVEHNLDTVPCTVDKDEKAEAPDAIDALAPGDHGGGLAAVCASNGAIEASMVDDLPQENTSGQNNLFQENETLTSSDCNPTEGYLIACNNDASGELANDTSFTLAYPRQEVANGQITCVKEEVLDSDNAQGSASDSIMVNDLVDLHQAATGESKLSVFADTHPPLVSYENAPLESQECSTAAPSRDKEPVVEFSDSRPVGNTGEHKDTREGTDATQSDDYNFHLVEDMRVQIGEETIHVVNDTAECCPNNHVTTEIEIGTISLTFTSRGSQSPKDVFECTGDMSECTGSNLVCSGDTCLHDLASNETGLATCQKDVKADDHVYESEVTNESVAGERTDGDAINRGDRSASVEGHVKSSQEVDGTETSTSSLEGSTTNASDGQNVLTEVRRPFYYMIKIPRYHDYNIIRDQIADAEFQVAEKTKSRDAIQAEKQVIRAKCTEYIDAIKAARAPRQLLLAKRREIDSVSFVIDRVKVASQVEDIDGKIRNMEHRMQHETLPLKEEKQLIREIKQLNQEREQLACKRASQNEVQQAIDQKDQAEERLKILKKEADLLRENCITAEAAAKVAEQKYNDEQKKLKELDTHFENANAIRQEAYAHLQSLRKQLYEKRRYFSQYKGDLERAKALALDGDREGLQHHCVSQVERVTELWNNDCEFRKDYMRCNLRSTIWRLGTLDGRSLGPDEEPPLIPNVIEKVAKVNIVASNPAAEGEKSVANVDTGTNNDKSFTNVVDKKNHTAKAKSPATPSPQNGLTTVSGGDKIGVDKNEQAREVEHKLTKEEEEMAKKAEELRKEEEAAMLKEQRRMEERAKAKEAMERKKRNADRALVRAAVKAQKEAEQKEKEREKRARKKEKKEENAMGDMNPAMGDSATSTEVLIESNGGSEAREKSVAVAKRPQKVQQFTKQTQAKSIPPPLRNRGKRKMQTWMWALVTIVVVFALFLLGNSSFSSKSWPERLRF